MKAGKKEKGRSIMQTKTVFTLHKQSKDSGARRGEVKTGHGVFQLSFKEISTKTKDNRILYSKTKKLYNQAILKGKPQKKQACLAVSLSRPNSVTDG